MRYRKEIDGLRALAVIPVILFHVGFKSFSGGFVGVDVFFVISGYLITTIILTEKLAVAVFEIVHGGAGVLCLVSCAWCLVVRP